VFVPVVVDMFSSSTVLIYNLVNVMEWREGIIFKT